MSGTNQENQQQNKIVGGQHHLNNGWTTRAEKLVRYWQEECRLYAWIYEQNVTYYSRLNRTLGIASITLSAITGTTLFNQSASDPDATSSNILIGLGVSSIASTILSGLKELLDLNSLITQNTNAARENSSIVMDIDEQLNMDRADRADGREFLKSIKDRKNSLIQNGPIIPSRQWKQVHKKIQSKEQLGFLNREVFNEYLEQSVDINKLQFGGGIGNSGANGYTIINNSSGAVDYGTPSSNSGGSAGYGSVAIDIPTDNQTLHKRAGLQEKMAFYGGIQPHVMPTTPITSINPTPNDLKILETEIENLQPRCAARKAILENQYELERLLSKTGELKNKDRQQIASLRDKARTYRETYQKLVNDTIADHSSIINMDCARVARLIKAYRDNNLSEPELFRVMQLHLMEIDTETFQYEIQINDIITKTIAKIDIQKAMVDEKVAQQVIAETDLRYPFRLNQSETVADTSTYRSFDQDDTIRCKLDELYSIRQIIKSDIDAILHELQDISDRIESLNDNPELQEHLAVQSSIIYEKQNELQNDYERVTRQIAELERVGTSKDNYGQSTVDTGLLAQSLGTDKGGLAPPILDVPPILRRAKLGSLELLSIRPPGVGLEFSVNGTFNTESGSGIAKTQTVSGIAAKKAAPPKQVTPIQPEQMDKSSRQQSRPSSTVPSDDEFIENMMGNNLCAKQLQDMIKPITLPNSPTSSPGQDSTTKSPKRRGSKYDAQMRYQTARIT